MDPVTLEQLSSVVNGRLLDVPDGHAQITNVSIDSRHCGPQDAFWALAGTRHDGHQFVDSLRGRCAVSVVGASQVEQTSGARIVVDDTLQALGQFAAWNRNQHDVLSIGVTGSVGKTTTRHVIHQVLSAQFHGIESPRNFNNHIGVPLTLLSIDSEHEFAVVEIGASASGEIAPLAQMAGIEIAVVTAVCPAHLSGFGSVENIVAAKREIIDQLPDSGFAVLNGDDPQVREMREGLHCRSILVGTKSGNDLRAKRIRPTVNGLRFEVRGTRFDLPVHGRHFLTSAMLAIGVAHEIGISMSQAAEQLAHLKLPAGRCSVAVQQPWVVIDDSYNSNPGSLHAACELLGEWKTGGRRILVCGDMLELGPSAQDWHQQAGTWAAQAGVDHLIVVGEHAADVLAGAMEGGLPRCQLAECQRMEALELVLECWLEPGDVVLVKGSRGMRLERVVEWLQQRAQQIHDSESIQRRLPAVA